MKRSLFPVVLIIASAIAGAQPADRLYSDVSLSTAYIRHILVLDAAYSKHPDLVRRLEKRIDRKLLGAEMVVSSGSGFVVSEDGFIVTNRHVAASGDIKKYRAAIASEMATGVAKEHGGLFSADEMNLLKTDLASMFNFGAYRLSVMVDGKALPM